MIVIVGAGLSGLTCAKVLHDRREPFMILEASDGPGGRVRTDQTASGYRLDHGFQVLFTAYPAARRHLSLARLNLCALDPEVIVARNGKHVTVAEPASEMGLLSSSPIGGAVSLSDRRRVAALRREMHRAPLQTLFEGADVSTLEFLKGRGFSERFIDTLMRPLYGALLLDRALEGSAAAFKFTFKMMAEGAVGVPEQGIGAISEQLVRHLPLNDVRYGARVAEVLIDESRAVGVRTADGIIVEADAVVVATDPPTAARLTGAAISEKPISSTCIHYVTPRSLYRGKKIVLNANPDALVNNLVQITNVSPSAAPKDQHLIVATVLGMPQGRDDDLAVKALEDIRRMFPGANLSTMRPLSVKRIPFSRVAQPPGFFAALPANQTAIGRLIVAGEATMSSSIQGAMLSGQRAAEAALRAIDTGAVTPV